MKKKDIKKLNSEAFKFDEELSVQCGIQYYILVKSLKMLEFVI